MHLASRGMSRLLRRSLPLHAGRREPVSLQILCLPCTRAQAQLRPGRYSGHLTFPCIHSVLSWITSLPDQSGTRMLRQSSNVALHRGTSSLEAHDLRSGCTWECAAGQPPSALTAAPRCAAGAAQSARRRQRGERAAGRGGGVRGDCEEGAGRRRRRQGAPAASARSATRSCLCRRRARPLAHSDVSADQ